MKYLDQKHRLFPYRRRVLAIPLLLAVFAIQGCDAFDRSQPQIQGALTDTISASKTVAAVASTVPSQLSTTTADVASLIGAIAASILIVDKAIEKSRTPMLASAVENVTPTTSKV